MNTLQTIKKFFVYLKPFWKEGIYTFLIILLSTAISVISPLLYKQIIDEGITSKNPSALFSIVGILILCIILEGVFKLLQTIISLNIKRDVFSKIRTDIYNHLQKMSQKFYSEKHSGGLMSRIINDVEAIQNLLLERFIFFIQELLLIVVIIGVLGYLNWRILLVSLIMLPILFVVYYIFSNKLHKMSKNVQEKQEELFETLQEDISAVKSIQSFNAEKDKLEKAVSQIKSTEEAKRSLSLKGAFASSSTIIISILGTLLLWGYGGYEVLNGRMSVGDLIAISFYLNYLNSLLMSVFTININFQISIPAANRIFEILDTVADIRDAEDAEELKEIKEYIEFENVSFGYNKDKIVIKNANLKAKKDTITAIIGPSGEGKTTLLSLIPRFYDPDEGCVMIDGKDIKKFKLDSLRKKIAIVPQDTFLFNTTIIENIVMGRSNIPPEKIVLASQLADAHGFIINFNDGYNTLVGERGTKLSGGQKKRIAIARALLENPDVLIFDEATADLDSESEKSIHQSIVKLSQNRIVFMITHKTSNLDLAEQILLVRNNRVSKFENQNELENYIKKIG